MGYPFHTNCWRCARMSAADRKRLLDALAHPGACLRCGDPACYDEACLDKDARQRREWAQAISPDHWTSTIGPKRGQDFQNDAPEARQ